ncbi:glycosyltransferase family 2 protein [Vibrio parahaemolyticus]|uniref:glycosyltransferase family 2 protein n=1 Tax=Vibrio parahaemolyticus TaxID=670 RepID=UPI0015DE9BAC|nr:glycosyltransferase [Vibrio parahaemolyticus]
MPKVSVIVPVYNMEKYLNRCCDSLVNQTLNDIEIILVNDASTDNSIDILRYYEEQFPGKVKVIDSEVNLRQGGARNLGIQIAQGDYIGFIDSDDWAELTMFEKLYENVVKKPYSICYCNYNTRYTTEEVFSVINRTSQIDWGKEEQLELQKQLLIKPSSIWSGIYSRDFFDCAKLRFPEKLFYEDNYLVPLLICHSENINKIEDALVNYFQGNISVTRSVNNYNFFDRLDCSRMLLNDFKEKKFNPELNKAIEFFFIETFLINTAAKCYTAFEPIQRDKVCEVLKEIENILPKFKENEYLRDKCKKNWKYGVFSYLLFNHKFILDSGFSLLLLCKKIIRK